MSRAVELRRGPNTQTDARILGAPAYSLGG